MIKLIFFLFSKNTSICLPNFTGINFWMFYFDMLKKRTFRTIIFLTKLNFTLMFSFNLFSNSSIPFFKRMFLTGISFSFLSLLHIFLNNQTDTSKFAIRISSYSFKCSWCVNCFFISYDIPNTRLYSS